ncbi:xylose isomerase [Hymenobacter aquaticus]|uniref:Xylose isomerase n=1 Tax=Hymenobacter aquaticus TaxID=1867101 RepID=A0A4Z0PYC9_9BACT|nr:metabolite traffic protein EboE [Hymenobacter aquaticus]TGE22309.1 xylose isomerase [Hymenobacter aquaticus]
MNIGHGYHLTYCTNIHPGETWAAVFQSLQDYLLPIKARLAPTEPLAVGLRLSDQASRELAQPGQLAEFQAWLTQQGLYVPIINGFPFGNFHHTVVKDAVHQPDWTTPARLAYTKRLAHQLATLLPAGLDGGISTSPLSYKPWLAGDEAHTATVLQQSARQLAELVEELVVLQRLTNRLIHLDIEPEPDGLLETSAEFVAFYQEYLLPQATARLQARLGLSAAAAHQAVFDHVRLCYDVCHFALAYEAPADVLARLAAAGIKVGRVQLSAALKADLPADSAGRQEIARQFARFVEPAYLHQVVARSHDGRLRHYPDLPPALADIDAREVQEWRTHFHVPIFLERYEQLQSTQAELRQVLALLAGQPITRYLEVETYTWDVLPPSIKQDLATSIERELQWVRQALTLPATAPASAIIS